MEELLRAAKQFLSIVSSSKLKDTEIKILVHAGLKELERSGIDTKFNYNEKNETYDDLIKASVMMFVKSRFGNVDIKEKEYALRSFDTLQQSLSLSEGYKKEVA